MTNQIQKAVYIYQSRNDRDILRQTLLDFLENQEYDKGMEYFQIMRQYQYENINNSKKEFKKIDIIKLFRLHINHVDIE